MLSQGIPLGGLNSEVSRLGKFISRPRSFLKRKEWRLDLFLLKINDTEISNDSKWFWVSLEKKKLKRKKERKIPKAAKKNSLWGKGAHLCGEGITVKTMATSLKAWRKICEPGALA